MRERAGGSAALHFSQPQNGGTLVSVFSAHPPLTGK
jgi:hypothetical protein